MWHHLLCRKLQTFPRDLLFPPFALKIEAAFVCGMSLNFKWIVHLVIQNSILTTATPSGLTHAPTKLSNLPSVRQTFHTSAGFCRLLRQMIVAHAQKCNFPLCVLSYTVHKERRDSQRRPGCTGDQDAFWLLVRGWRGKRVNRRGAVRFLSLSKTFTGTEAMNVLQTGQMFLKPLKCCLAVTKWAKQRLCLTDCSWAHLSYLLHGAKSFLRSWPVFAASPLQLPKDPS
jgi:hypothetical protein